MKMNLQPAAKQELIRIAIGTLVCSAVMVAVFAVLGLFGVVKFDYTVVLGALGGSAVAILNFAAMCLTVQSATTVEDEKRSRAKMQLSYNFRLLGQALWCILAFILACFQPVAGMLPLLFPRLVIYYLQLTGKYRAPAKKSAADSAAPAAQPGDEGKG
jgi:hypothetical protein